MRPRFGPGVSSHPIAPDLAGGEVQRGPVPLVAETNAWTPLEAAVHAIAPVAEIAASRSVALTLDAPAVQAHDPGAPTPVASRRYGWEAVPVLSHFQAFPPLTTRARDLSGCAIAARVHAPEPIPAPAVHRGLEVARRQLASKRVVPARLLSEEQLAYWVERLSNAKRVRPKLIDLVGIIPDVPLSGDRPVAYRAEQQAIAYHLPDQPVPLSTVVIAKHVATGAMLLGRFASE